MQSYSISILKTVSLGVMGPGMNGMAGSPGPGNHYGMQVKNICMQLSLVTLKQMQFGTSFLNNV